MAACVQAGANHVDISGEPQYLEKMQLKYNEEAKVRIYRSWICHSPINFQILNLPHVT